MMGELQQMKAILIIDIADDIAESYKNFTVDYDLRGEDEDGDTVSIRFVEDAKFTSWYEDEVSKNESHSDN